MSKKYSVTTDIETKDASPRGVDIPPELAAQLRAEKEARAAFDRLAPSHQREYVNWINEAKKPETRARRVAQTIEKLKAGK